MKTALITVGLSILIFFASVGAIFLIMPRDEPAQTVSKPCPNLVHYEDGSTACVIATFEGSTDLQRTADINFWQGQ